MLCYLSARFWSRLIDQVQSWQIDRQYIDEIAGRNNADVYEADRKGFFSCNLFFRCIGLLIKGITIVNCVIIK